MRQPDGAQPDAGQGGSTGSPEPACGVACGRRDPTPMTDDRLAGTPGPTAGLLTRLGWAWDGQ